MSWNLWTVTRTDEEGEWVVCFGYLHDSIEIDKLMLQYSSKPLRTGMRELEHEFFVGECPWEDCQVIKVVTRHSQFDKGVIAMRLWVLEDLFFKGKPKRTTQTRLEAVFSEFTWNQGEVSAFWQGFRVRCQEEARHSVKGNGLSVPEYEAFLKEIFEGVRFAGTKLTGELLATVATEVQKVFRRKDQSLGNYYASDDSEGRRPDEPWYYGLKGAGVVHGSFLDEYRQFLKAQLTEDG